jgi:DNA-binding GntR family transcriptional regulator
MAGVSIEELQSALSGREANDARQPRRDPSGSLTAWATEQIRQAIVEGRLPLGGALSELRLAAALGVSRTPVREALNALQQQGLIDIQPQSGSFVFLPSEEAVGELCEFRRIAEVAALRLCFARRSEDALRQLRAANAAMERATSTGDGIAISRADAAFHQAIADHSTNSHLIKAYKLISGRVGALLTYNLTANATARKRSMAEHRAMIVAFARGDIDRAEAILDEHISRMRIVFRTARNLAAAAD